MLRNKEINNKITRKYRKKKQITFVKNVRGTLCVKSTAIGDNDRRRVVILHEREFKNRVQSKLQSWKTNGTISVSI